MSGRHTADPAAALLIHAGQPLLLSGPPRSIRGHLDVHNQSDQKVVRLPRLHAVRDGTHATKASAKSPALHAPLSETLALRRIVVRPHTHRSVPISLALDPHTTPGTYEAKLEVEGEVRDVVLHVTEDLSFSMTPAALILPNRPGEKFNRQVMVANRGNVPLVLKSIGAVVLDDELAGCRAVRGALHEVGATMTSVDDFAVALGQQLAKIYETLSLKVQNDKLNLEPGKSQLMDLRITLPDKLNDRARYTGFAAISTGNLAFTIVPD